MIRYQAHGGDGLGAWEPGVLDVGENPGRPAVASEAD